MVDVALAPLLPGVWPRSAVYSCVRLRWLRDQWPSNQPERCLPTGNASANHRGVDCITVRHGHCPDQPPSAAPPFSGNRSNNYNTPQSNRSRSAVDYPIVSVTALTQLADWYQAYRELRQEEEACPIVPQGKKHRSGASCAPGNRPARMVSVAGGDPAADTAQTQPTDCPTPSPRCGRTGGEV